MSDDSMEVRMALLETSVKQLVDAAEARDKKLDTLLELKYRGMGALWFAALLFGSSIIGGISTVMSWIRH